MNCCSIAELREKEVISISDGCRIGEVCDVEIDTCTGCLVSIVIWGRSKLFGILGRYDDIKICWKDIKVIGDETILVDFDCPKECKKCRNNNIFEALFKHS